MGMFDTVVGECPSCKTEFQIQTKLMDCLMETIVIGDAFMRATYTGKIGLKWGCDNCEKTITAHIEKGILTKFSTEKADVYEGLGGSLNSSLEEVEQRTSDFLKRFPKLT